MRVCELHRVRATITLKSNEGIEYDLCPECKKLLEEILEGKKEDHERGGTAPKAKNSKK